MKNGCLFDVGESCWALVQWMSRYLLRRYYRGFELRLVFIAVKARFCIVLLIFALTCGGFFLFHFCLETKVEQKFKAD